MWAQKHADTVKLKLKEELTLKGTQTIELLLEKSKVQLEPDRCSHDPRTWWGDWGDGVQRDAVFLHCKTSSGSKVPSRLIHPCQWGDLVHGQRSEMGCRTLPDHAHPLWMACSVRTACWKGATMRIWTLLHFPKVCVLTGLGPRSVTGADWGQCGHSWGHTCLSLVYQCMLCLILTELWMNYAG